MKYMTVWNIKEENFKAVLERWGKEPDLPEGVTQLGRWHEVGTGRGYRLIETDDPIALSRLALFWTDLVDMRTYPVIDDDETREALKG